jgi:hypothetical protein
VIHAGAVAFLCAFFTVTAPAAAAVAPKLRPLFSRARLVVGGTVGEVETYASGRVAVAHLAVSQTLKGAPPQGAKLFVIESRELPTPPIFEGGMRGVAFVQPARLTSFLRQTLPPRSYSELADKHAFLACASEAELAEMVGIFNRLASASRLPEADAAKRADADRRLVFDLVAARHPVLVEDGAASLTSVADLAATLTEDEQARLETALLRADLEDRIRVALIAAVGTAGLRQLAPTLEMLRSPVAVREAAWKALDTLGAAPPAERLAEGLAADDPALRAAAARELLRREGVAAISQVAPLALQDRDTMVREAVVDALGASKRPEALPPLERVFEQETGKLQQAAARAIRDIGGPPAVESFGRLAFAAPPGGQRYAVMLLLTLTDRNDPVVKRIEETHPNETVRELIRHGIEVHKH